MLVEEFLGEQLADEARCTGDEDVHGGVKVRVTMGLIRVFQWN